MAEYVFPLPNYHGNPRATYHSQGGSDLFAPSGTPIYSVSNGVVRSAGYDNLGGYNVLIQGDDGRQYYYAHMLADALVSAGQRVAAGLQIGQVGNTGNASGTAPHLHIGIGYGISTGAGSDGGTGISFDAQTFLSNLLQSAGDAASGIARTVGDILGQAGGAVTSIPFPGIPNPGDILQPPTNWLWQQITGFFSNLMGSLTVATLLGSAPLIFMIVGGTFIFLALAGFALSGIDKVTSSEPVRAATTIAAFAG